MIKFHFTQQATRLVHTTISTAANKCFPMENVWEYLCIVPRFAGAKAALRDKPDWGREGVEQVLSIVDQKSLCRGRSRVCA